MELILFFILAVSIASFYTTLVYRIYFYFYTPERKKYSSVEKWKKILFESSNCESCKTHLTAISLIPVLGYFFSKEKCKSCGYKIPKIYFITEICFGILFIGLYFITKNLALSFSFLFLVGHLLLTAYTDYKKFSIDYENLPFIFLFGFLVHYFFGENFFTLERLYVFLFLLVLFLILHFFSPNGLGLGDVFFVSVFGYITGFPLFILFLNFAYIIGFCISFLIRDKTKSFLKMKVPMGIYFSISLLIVLLLKFGNAFT